MYNNAVMTPDELGSYTPSPEILQRYADVLINFALGSGNGIKKGEVVQLVVPDVAKPLARELQNAVLRAGGHPFMRFLPTEFDKDFYTLANDDQLTFFPETYTRERVNLVDHQVYIIAVTDPYELKDVDPTKILKARDAKKAYVDWTNEKENQGKFTWTIALWATHAKAATVKLSYEEYWQQIIEACFLDKPDPIAEWRNVFTLQEKIKAKLNELSIEWLHVVGPDADLKVQLGKNRVWHGGSGRNIPSFELFTSPDWRGTQGWIRFNQPLYRYGNVIRDVYLRFEKGLIVEAKAEEGNDFLQQMLKSPNANKIG